MTFVLGLALAVPLVGAVATVVVARTVDARRAVTVVKGSALASAALWALLVAAGDAPALGRLEVTASAAAATCGLAVLTAALAPRSSLVASSSLCSLTVFAAASMAGTGTGPDRPLAVGVALLAVLAVARARSERMPMVGLLVAGAAGMAITTGLLLDDRAGAVAVVIAAAAVAVMAVRSDGALLLVPVVLYATLQSARGAQEAQGAGAVDVVAIGAVIGALAAALTVHLLARSPHRSVNAFRAWPVSAALVAVVLLAQDLPVLRSAGLLLSAGAVLAAACPRPVGMVACLPGLAAAVEGFGAATEPIHAAAGATAVAVVGAALLIPDRTAEPVAWTIHAWTVAAAAGFAIIPLWGWTNVDDAGFRSAITVAVAAGLAAAVATALGAFLHPVPGRHLGRLRDRPRADIHGSTHSQVQEADPAQARSEEVGAPAGEAPAEHPVARPARVVPGGAAGGGGRGRRRLRAGPGRTTG